MLPLRIFTCIVATVVILELGGPASSRAVELITNGGFETGDFTGWIVSDLTGNLPGSFKSLRPGQLVLSLETARDVRSNQGCRFDAAIDANRQDAVEIGGVFPALAESACLVLRDRA